MVEDVADTPFKKNEAFNFYRQGFFISNFALNGETLAKSQNEADDILNTFIEDFNKFYEQIEKSKEKTINIEQTSNDLIEKKEERQLLEINTEEKVKKDDLALNRGKFLTKCQLCGKNIFANDIDFDNINTSNVKNFPLPFIYIHSHENHGLHAIILYIDKNNVVRGKKPTTFFKIQT